MRIGPKMQQAINYLKYNGPTPRGQLVRYIGQSSMYGYQTINRLRDKGLICVTNGMCKIIRDQRGAVCYLPDHPIAKAIEIYEEVRPNMEAFEFIEAFLAETKAQ